MQTPIRVFFEVYAHIDEVPETKNQQLEKSHAKMIYSSYSMKLGNCGAWYIHIWL